MSLNRVKQADEKTKCIIFGYSREKQDALSIKIPMMVQYLFLAYYWIQELFTKHGQGMRMDASCKKVTREGDYILINEWYNTVYGNNVVDVNDTSIRCYKWRFKIYGEPFILGIDSSTNVDKLINWDFANPYENKADYYSICTAGETAYTINSKSDSNERSFDKIWGDGDIITLTLLMDWKELLCTVNDAYEYTVAENIDFDKFKSFNVAISIERESDSVELLSFQIWHYEA